MMRFTTRRLLASYKNRQRLDDAERWLGVGAALQIPGDPFNLVGPLMRRRRSDGAITDKCG